VDFGLAVGAGLGQSNQRRPPRRHADVHGARAWCAASAARSALDRRVRAGSRSTTVSRCGRPDDDEAARCSSRCSRAAPSRCSPLQSLRPRRARARGGQGHRPCSPSAATTAPPR
jgi:hypothetical protein